MKLEYLRIEDFTLLNKGIPSRDWLWLEGLADVERRDDYCCWFVLKGSKSHTQIALKFGDIFS